MEVLVILLEIWLIVDRLRYDVQCRELNRSTFSSVHYSTCSVALCQRLRNVNDGLSLNLCDLVEKSRKLIC